MAGSKSYTKGSTPFRNADHIALARALAADKINVRGTGRREVAKPRRSAEEADRTPNWDKWRLLPEPRLWQCVALSLNIDPDSIEIDSVFGRDPILPRRLREFGDRIDIARENLHRTLRCTAVTMDRPLQSRVSLRGFAVWVRQLGLTAPAELLAMADQRPQNVNWDYWRALDLWPLDAACKLISGDNPNEPTRRGDIENPDITNRPEWVNVYHQAVSAIKARNLSIVNGEVTPAEFIAWAQGKGIPIPPELARMGPATVQATPPRTHNPNVA